MKELITKLFYEILKPKGFDIISIYLTNPLVEVEDGSRVQIPGKWWLIVVSAELVSWA